jgi:hypothetical protein
MKKFFRKQFSKGFGEEITNIPLNNGIIDFSVVFKGCKFSFFIFFDY